MALLAYALTTVARFKTFIGKTTNEDDTLIETLINVATEYVETYCDRRFLSTANSNQEYDGTGREVLMLRNYPVSSSASFTLEERDTAQNQANWSSIDSTNYHVDYDAGLVQLIGYRFTETPKRYRVTYTSGYAFDNATPGATMESVGLADLEFAVWKIVNNLYQKAAAVGGVTSETIGNYSVSYDLQYQLLTPETQFILTKYRRQHTM